MATATQILSDIDLRYRNTFTVDQKLVWFNEEQRELFDVLELDSAPFTFQTVLGQNFYPFPDQFDVTKIKVVTYQMSHTEEPAFQEIPFKRNDDDQYGIIGPWYTIVQSTFFLYVPEEVPADRTVYIYLDRSPDDVTTSVLNVEPALPIKFQELLKFGILKRIAMARKDVVFYQNYSDTYAERIAEILWDRKLAEPDWIANTDEMPRAGNYWGIGSFRYGFPWWGGN